MMMTSKQRPIASPWGWLFWIPVWLTLGYAVWQLVKTFLLGFCAYNVLEPPRFIGLRNYVTLFQDEVIGICLSNTVRVMLTAGLAVLLVGVILGLFAARLPLPCGLGLGYGLGLASLSVMLPGGWERLLSGDVYGLLNAWLGFAENPVQWVSVHGFAVQNVLLFFLCLAPVYGIVYFCARRGYRRAGIMISVCAVPILMAGGWPYIMRLVGYPSTNYSADWLPSIIYDYGNIRFELGMSAALQTVGLALVLLWCVIGCLAVWGIAGLRRQICRNACEKRRPTAAWIIWGIGLLALLVMLLPLLIILCTSLTPMEELFLYPPRLLPIAPTLQGYHDFFTVMDSVWAPFFTVSLLWQDTWYLLLAYATVVLPAGIGLAWFHYRGKKIGALLCLGVWGVFSLSITTAGNVFMAHVGDSLPLIVAFFTGPIFPLSLLLTAWILDTGFSKVIAGTAALQWKRVWLTIAGIATTACMVGLSHMYFVCPFIYREESKPFLQRLQALVSGGIARCGSVCAGSVLLLIPIAICGLLLLVILLLLRQTDRKDECRSMPSVSSYQYF
ncbi:MAG: hypothetical protein PUB00_01895 [Clostridiales bacterium]|nr:hypothetical protein [Clostridiales bacterium]